MEQHAFLSPVYYNLFLGATYLGKKLGIFKPIDPLFHNYNMTIQSCILLSLSIYEYYKVANEYHIPYIEFITISNQIGRYHQTDNSSQWILYVFLTSKLFEWIDTALLIINSKKIIGLHWWHHATIGVAFYTGFYVSSVIWIASLNSFIHIIMYLYYANVSGIRHVAKYLTQLQIIQLFGGVYMNYVSYNYNTDAKFKTYSLINGMICLSYGLMFLQFYSKKYKPLVTKPIKPKEPKFVIIGEYKYDITNFKHPGGNVINYMTNGQNATEAFNEFHFRSKKALATLNSLPKTKLDEPHATDREILDEFTIFRESLVKRGFFKPSYVHVTYRFIELFGLFSLATYMIQKNVLIAAMIFGLFGGRCGWVQHEGGHNSLTGNIRIDKLIQEFFIGFGLHVSGNMWNKMHNKHHTTPQKIKYDIDLDTTPLVAFFDTAIESNRSRYYSKLWLKYQAYTFLPLTSGIFVPLFWAIYLHPRQIIRDGNFRQAIFVIMGHVIRISLFMHVGGYTLPYAFYYHIMSTWWGDMYLFGHFSLSHTFTPVIESHEDPSWVRYAIEHSVDINPTNPFINWIMGYLNCQVIHHLFPSMPQYRGPEVSKELIVLCKKWGIKYTILGYREAWVKMFQNLNDVGEAYSKDKTE